MQRKGTVIHMWIRTTMLAVAMVLACASAAGQDPWQTPFTRGDANQDGVVDLSDPVAINAWLFLGGPAPTCGHSANANDDASVDGTDAIYLLTYLFLAGPPPLPPFPYCGPDLTFDTVPCSSTFCAFDHGQKFVRGDVNGDKVVTTGDLNDLGNRLFQTPWLALPCESAGDFDDDGDVDGWDWSALSAFIFTGGPQPRPPFPDCGEDPVADGIWCAASACF